MTQSAQRGALLALASAKGGVGKSTLACALAKVWSDRGLSVCLVDVDPQGSSLDVSGETLKLCGSLGYEIEDFSALFSSQPLMATKKVRDLAARFDVVILDTAGNIENEGTQAALISADLTLIPLPPAPNDLKSTQMTISLLQRRVQVANPSGLVRVVFNRPRTTNISAAIMQAATDMGMPMLNTVIPESTAYQVLCTGIPLLNQPKRPSKAIDAISGLSDELAALLQLQLTEAA